MDIKPILNKLGMTKKEADLYLACLEYGPETITNLARLSGYKRTTLYNIIEGLVQKGFLLSTNRNRRVYFDAEKPKKILATFKSRQQELEQILPDLESLHRAKHSLPVVDIYETDEAIARVYEEIFSYLNPKEEVLFFSSIADLNKYALGVLDKWFSVVAAKPDGKARELIFDDEAGRKYLKTFKQNKLKHQVKLLPADFPFYNDIIIYGNRIAIFSFHQHSFVTVIENLEVAQTLRTLYEWAWLNGK